MVEHVEVEVEPADERIDCARIEVCRNQRRLDARHLRERPAELLLFALARFASHDADDRTGSDRIDILAGLGGKVPAPEAVALVVKLHGFIGGNGGNDFLRGRFKNDRGQHEGRGGRARERGADRLGAFFGLAYVDESFGAAVAVLAVVSDEVPAHGFDRGELVCRIDGRVDIQTARISFVAEDVVNEHAR